MPLDKIRLLSKAFPNTKIIFVLRNPIERAWSDVIMNLKRFNNVEYSDDKQRYLNLLKIISHRGLYSQQIKKWLRYFPKKQLN